MANEFYFSNNQLFICSEEEQKNIKVEFKSQIYGLAKIKSNFIVRTKNDGAYGDRNVFRVSEEGKIVWQVQHPFECRNIKSNSSAAFTYLGLKDGKIIGGSIDCFNYEIDFETGKLSNPIFTK